MQYVFLAGKRFAFPNMEGMILNMMLMISSWLLTLSPTGVCRELDESQSFSF